MTTEPTPKPAASKLVWVGRVISALPVLMLVMSGVMKFIQPAGFAEGFAKLGWEPKLGVPLGIVELTSTVLYVIPQTCVLGAILLTGYLGGAIAAHVRLGEPFIMQALFGILVWLGLFLRDARLRDLLPFRR